MALSTFFCSSQKNRSLFLKEEENEKVLFFIECLISGSIQIIESLRQMSAPSSERFAFANDCIGISISLLDL